MPRPAIAQVTQDRIAELVAAGLDNRAIAKDVGVADTTVRRYRRLAPTREAKDNGSLKRRLLHAIVARDFDNVTDLMDVVRSPSDNFSDHEVIHILFGLQRQGLITFRGTRGAGAGKTTGPNTRLLNIRATRVTPASIAPFKNGIEASAHATVVQIMEAEEAEAVADGFSPVHTAKPEVIEAARNWSGELTKAGIEPPHTFIVHPAGMMYPLLADLRVKRDVIEADKVRLAKYIEAAELLADVDPDESERLFNRAAEEETVLKPIEIEYLAYATAHEGAPS